MTQYALINDNTVVNVVLADTAYVNAVKDRYQAIVEVTAKELVQIGDPYDSATGKIKRPPLPEPPTPEELYKNISAVAFRERFTTSELADIYEAATTNSGVALFVDELKAYDVVGAVDPTAPRLAELLALIPTEILSIERRDEITSAPV